MILVARQKSEGHRNILLHALGTPEDTYTSLMRQAKRQASA